VTNPHSAPDRLLTWLLALLFTLACFTAVLFGVVCVVWLGVRMYGALP
jgi:hypothetical protein